MGIGKADVESFASSLSREVRKAMVDRDGMKGTRLAEEAGVSENVVSKIVNGRPVEYSSLVRVLLALDFRLVTRQRIETADRLKASLNEALSSISSGAEALARIRDMIE